jgi:hypothetical protein
MVGLLKNNSKFVLCICFLIETFLLKQDDLFESVYSRIEKLSTNVLLNELLIM